MHGIHKSRSFRQIFTNLRVALVMFGHRLEMVSIPVPPNSRLATDATDATDALDVTEVQEAPKEVEASFFFGGMDL